MKTFFTDGEVLDESTQEESPGQESTSSKDVAMDESSASKESGEKEACTEGDEKKPATKKPAKNIMIKKPAQKVDKEACTLMRFPEWQCRF